MPRKKVTFSSRQGPRSYQEDFSIHIPIQESKVQGWLLAVMDGHGGPEVSELIAQETGKTFKIKDVRKSEEALSNLVSVLNAKTVHFRDVGSTLSVVCVVRGPSGGFRASVAVLGDSPIVVLDKNGKLHISPEHNIRSNIQERQAAEQRGGVCMGGYLYL
ncbi:MAG: hypothetical protein ABIF06_02525, partial [bacterium]